MTFHDFLNPWIVGIGGSVLGGIIVTLISRMLFSRRENRELNQKIEGANREVLYAIRPSISEGKLPTNKVIETLIFATARKYGISENEMNNRELISDDLIKEVMDTSFLSSESKFEYCKELLCLKEKIGDEDKTTKVRVPSMPSQSTYGFLSVYTGVMVTTMSLLLVVFSRLNTEINSEDVSTSAPILIIVIVAGVTLLMLIFTILFRDMIRRRSYFVIKNGKDDEKKN